VRNRSWPVKAHVVVRRRRRNKLGRQRGIYLLCPTVTDQERRVRTKKEQVDHMKREMRRCPIKKTRHRHRRMTRHEGLHDHSHSDETHNLELHRLPLKLDRANFEVDSNSADVAFGVGIIRKTQEQARLFEEMKTVIIAEFATRANSPGEKEPDGPSQHQSRQ
jgi:hypothetical protein